MIDYKISPVNSVNYVNLYYNNNNRQNQESQDISQNKSQDDFKKVLRDTVSIEASKKEVDYMVCNHNPNDKNSTLEKINKRVMVTPTTFWFRCNKCYKGFKFVKNDNGELEEADY